MKNTTNNGYLRGFETEDDGLYRIVQKKDEQGQWQTRREHITYSPIKVTGIVRDSNSNQWGINVQWQDADDKPHSEVIPFEVITGDPSELIKRLSQGGLVISPKLEHKRWLQHYLSAMRTIVTCRYCSVSTPGWFENSFITSSGEVINQRMDEPILCTGQVDEAYGPEGSIDGWINGIAKYGIRNPLLMFCIFAGFSPPLLSLLDCEGGGFHFWGESSKGKSSIFWAQFSIWWNPKKILTWRATANGIEGKAALSNDCLLMLDDMSQAEPEHIKEVVYFLCNGRGKQRASKSGEPLKVTQFRNFVMSNGEIRVKTALERKSIQYDAGLDVRLLNIHANVYEHGALSDYQGFSSPSAFADHLKETANRHHGHAGRLFLEMLCKNLEDNRENCIVRLKNYVSEWKKQYASSYSNSQICRAATRFAVVAAAGRLAIEWDILPFESDAAFSNVGAIFSQWLDERGTVGNLEVHEIVERVFEFIEKNRFKHFIDLHDESPKNQAIAGLRVNRAIDSSDGEKIEVTDFWFTSSGLAEAGKRPARIVAKTLHEHGYLAKGEKGLMIQFGAKHYRGHRFYVVPHEAVIRFQDTKKDGL